MTMQQRKAASRQGECASHDKAASQQGECASHDEAATRQDEIGEVISPSEGHSPFYRPKGISPVAKQLHRPQGISPSAGHSPILTNNAITRNK